MGKLKTEANLLCTLFNTIYGRNFISNQKNDKLLMQKMIYFFMGLGFYWKDYNFFWHVRGPYSHALAFELLEMENTNKDGTQYEKINLEPFNIQDKIEIITKIINGRPHYSKYEDYKWVETLASIHFFKSRRYSTKNKEDILSLLKNEKPHVDENNTNKSAWKLLEANNMFK